MRIGVELMAIIVHEHERGGLFSREQYCYQCGGKMNRKEFFKRTVKIGDRDYLRYCSFWGIYFATFEVYGYRFCCEPCNFELDCKEQYRIAEIQKRLKKKRLTSDEVGIVALPEPPAPIPELTPQEKRKQTFALVAIAGAFLLVLAYVAANIFFRT